LRLRIQEHLNPAGLTTASGKPFTHNAVRQTLRNPRNAGMRVHQSARRRTTAADARCRVVRGCNNGTTVVDGSKGKDQPLYQCSRAKHLMRALAPIDE
jgi:hypothetical protein